MKKERFRSFFTGALVGVGLGILLAPKEGNETREDLKKTFLLLIDTIKNVDVEETKAYFLKKIKEIKEELSNIDSDTAKEVVEEKIVVIEKKCFELMEEAKIQELPVVEKAIGKIKENAEIMLRDFVDELEEVTLQEKDMPMSKEKKKANTRKKKLPNQKKDLPKKSSSKNSK